MPPNRTAKPYRGPAERSRYLIQVEHLAGWKDHSSYPDEQAMEEAYRRLILGSTDFLYRMLDLEADTPEVRQWHKHRRHQSFLARLEPQPSPAFLKRINAAMARGSQVDITYQDIEENITERRIQPQAWVQDDLFAALCHLRDGERHFRVHRMIDCRIV